MYFKLFLEAASAAAKFKGGIQVISTTAVPGGMVVNLSMYKLLLLPL